MSVIEIVLIIIGAVILFLGYILPAGKKEPDQETERISEAEIKRMVEDETDTVRQKVSDIVDETIGYMIERTERAMERVANEKIMAVNEYSDTVLEEINKNHKEVTFLYDMLNDKHETLMASIGEANQMADEIKQTVRDAEITAQETARKAKDAGDAADEALVRIRDAEMSARDAQEAVQEAVESVMGAVQDTRTDIWSLHNTGGYVPDVVETVEAEDVDETDYAGEAAGAEALQDSPVQKAFFDVSSLPTAGEPAFRQPEETGKEVDFQPIKARRVEIVHEPEMDYVAPEPDIPAGAAFAQTGVFGEKGFVPEEPRSVDIRFAQGKDNGRNSNERILELHKAGKSNMAIAKELGLGLGEVKLVIDLFEGM